MNAKPQIVRFNKQQLPVFFQNDKPYVAMKPICENIGLDWVSQHKRIQRNHIFNSTMVIMTNVAQDGKNREMLCLPLGFLNGWLMGVNVNKVKPEIKETLVKYQLECYDVLYKHFMPKPVKQIDLKDYVSKKDHDEMVIRYHRLFRKYDDSIDQLRDQMNEMLDKSRRYDQMIECQAVTVEKASQMLSVPVARIIEELEIAQLVEKRLPYVIGAPLIWMTTARNKALRFVVIDSVVEDGQAKDQIKLTENGFCYMQQLLQSRLKS